MDHYKQLASISIFKGLPEAELKKLASAAKEGRIVRGTEVMIEGRENDALFVILLGTVRILKRSDRDVEEELAVLGSGSYFGEAELVSPEHISNARVVAAEDLHVLIFKRESIEKLCEADPKLGYELYRALARGLARRLANTSSDAAHFKSIAMGHEA